MFTDFSYLTSLNPVDLQIYGLFRSLTAEAMHTIVSFEHALQPFLSQLLPFHRNIVRSILEESLDSQTEPGPDLVSTPIDSRFSFSLKGTQLQCFFRAVSAFANDVLRPCMNLYKTTIPAHMDQPSCQYV